MEEEDGEWRVMRTWKGKPSHVRRLLHKSIAEDGHASYCPGYGPNLNSAWDAEEEDTLRQKLQKSLERVRSSVFYKKLIEQMQCLQILESLLANARRAQTLHHDQMVMNEFLNALSSFGPNSADHEVCTFRFADGMYANKTMATGSIRCAEFRNYRTVVTNHDPFHVGLEV
jgi:hypothetical protein